MPSAEERERQYPEVGPAKNEPTAADRAKLDAIAQRIRFERNPEESKRGPGVSVCVPVLAIKGQKVLMLHRVNDAKFCASKWLFPGGEMEDIDGSLEACAIRELAAETGLLGSPPELVGVNQFRATDGRLWIGIIHKTYVDGDPVIREPDVHDLCRFVDPWHLSELQGGTILAPSNEVLGWIRSGKVEI